jgi:hypothetical protein
MLTQKAPYITAFKLITTEEIMAKVVEIKDNGDFVVEKPVQLVVDPDSKKPSFVPYFVTTDFNRQQTLFRHQILMSGPLPPQIQSAYESAISVVYVPAKPGIITNT